MTTIDPRIAEGPFAIAVDANETTLYRRFELAL